jgi:hypothetical protein
MKFYFFLLAGITQPALVQPQASHPKPEKVTALCVEASSLGYRQVVRVTADSLIVYEQVHSEPTQYIHYARALNAKEHDDLLAPFNRIYLSSLQSSYEGNNAPDDGMTFQLFIQKGKKAKSVRIYMYKLLPMYVFSTRLNLLLPPRYRIAYNKQYFNYLR